MDGGRGEQGRGERLLSRVVPWILLVIVVWIAVAAYTDYRSAIMEERRSGSSEDTSSVEPTSTGEAPEPPPAEDAIAEPASGTVVVLADGLNLRTKPNTTSTVIKRLPTGSKLDLLETVEGWYRVRDADGYEGWVAAGGSYTRRED